VGALSREGKRADKVRGFASYLKSQIIAPKAQEEGSQTCNVWESAGCFCALKMRQEFLGARPGRRRLMTSHQRLHPPSADLPLATFFAPLCGYEEVSKSS
jgi:hypothetical protein